MAGIWWSACCWIVSSRSHSHHRFHFLIETAGDNLAIADFSSDSGYLSPILKFSVPLFETIAWTHKTPSIWAAKP
jgi:hypothetical protein